MMKATIKLPLEFRFPSGHPRGIMTVEPAKIQHQNPNVEATPNFSLKVKIPNLYWTFTI